MRVDPEGPERVVEVEDEQFGQGAAVLEGLRRERVGGEGTGGSGGGFRSRHYVMTVMVGGVGRGRGLKVNEPVGIGGVGRASGEFGNGCSVLK